MGRPHLVLDGYFGGGSHLCPIESHRLAGVASFDVSRAPWDDGLLAGDGKPTGRGEKLDPSRFKVGRELAT
jgi:hypothetical protein